MAAPRLLFVEAAYYSHISTLLAAGADAAAAAVGAQVERFAVPGALEIPGVIAQAALTGRYDAYVALGCVIRGETSHYDTVCTESARGLMDLTIRDRLAIGNGIITVETEVQALARADVHQLDKGGGAVRAALALLVAARTFNKLGV